MRSALVALALVCAFPVAGDVPEEESFKGVTGVMVIVERLHEDATAIGLERETLDAVVRDGLQKAGVKILSPDERVADERQPYLYVNCNVMHVNDAGLVAFSMDIEMHQRVTLANGDKTRAQTWGKSYLGVQGRERAAAQIRHVLGGYVTQFVEAFAKANGKPATAPTSGE